MRALCVVVTAKPHRIQDHVAEKTLHSMSRNQSPLATEDQEAVERAALALRDLAIVQKAVADAAQAYKDLVQHDPGSESLFADEFEQLAFTALERAVNSDPNYPRIHAVNLAAHLTDGRAVPATKVMHPSPDFIYRMAPVDGAARFALHGRMPPDGPIAFEVSVLAENGVTQANLSLADLKVSPDGSFMISIDPNPMAGRPNHLQSGPATHQLMIRDIFDHIERQRPIALRIDRLDPPTRQPLAIEELVARVTGELTRANLFAAAVVRGANAETNVLLQPGFLKGDAALLTQAYSMGRFKLRENQALVITLTLGAAGYAVVPVTNCWGGLGDFPHHRTVISMGHATPNPDGSYTLVLAHRDPTAINWVQTGGLSQGYLCIRWTAFKRGDESRPTLEAKLVDWAELDAALPTGTPRMPQSDRQRQLAQHVKDYTAWEGD